MADSNKIGVVGLGLIGAALAQLVAKCLPNMKIIGVDPNDDHTRILHDRLDDFERRASHTELKDCKYIFIATPPHTISKIAIDILSNTTEDTVVIDLASTKERIVNEVCESSAFSSRFIGGHPLAGGNLIGPSNSSHDTLSGATFLLTPHKGNTRQTVDETTEFLNQLMFNVRIIGPKNHDQVIAVTSHFPHLLAYTYAKVLVDEIGTSQAQKTAILDSSSRSTRRISEFASQNSEMWADIFEENVEMISTVIDKFILQLLSFRVQLRQGNFSEVSKCLESAAQMTTILNEDRGRNNGSK